MNDQQQHSEAASIDAGGWHRLALRLAALASVAGEAAHRFNNLRAVIDGTLALIAADPASGLTPRRLERVREAAARAEALAGAMAALGRRHATPDTELDLAAWLRGARPWLVRLLARETELALELPDTPRTLLADPDGLRAAVAALVLNAAAAVGSGGRVGIRLAAAPAPAVAAHSTLSLTVADSGPGMPPEIAARAREPFFTTRPPAAGLGLTVAEAFATDRGGRLELASAPGQGTTVTLHLVA